MISHSSSITTKSSHVINKIENIELFNFGFSAKLGRYPIHFHIVGNVADSYIRNNVIHQTFNRGITVHGLKQLTLDNIVVYDTLGHSILLEDEDWKGHQK